MIRLWFAGLLLAGCGGEVTPMPPDLGPDMTPPPFGIEITAVIDGGALYPFDPQKGDHGEHWVRLPFRVTLHPGTEERQDLRIAVAPPKALRGPQVSISGGWYNGSVGMAYRAFDWLSPQMGSIKTDVLFQRNPKIFEDNNEALQGDLEFRVKAQIVQYEEVIAESGEAIIQGYYPKRLSDQNFSVYSGQVDGEYLYLSARANGGPFGGQGGVYRVKIGSGTVEHVATHKARGDQTVPFLVDGDTLYFVSFLVDDGTSVLMKGAKDGTGTPAQITIAKDARNVLAIGRDTTHIYLALEMKGSTAAYRFSKADPAQGTAQSAGLGSLKRNTLAVTKDHFVLMRDDPPALLRLTKDLSTIDKLIDLGSTAGERTLVCDDSYCFWTEWYDGWLFRVPILGGTKVKLASTNQPILWDGSYLYSGINGLIRVAPKENSPVQRLFEGSVVPLLGLDEDYIYFGRDDRLWRLHK